MDKTLTPETINPLVAEPTNQGTESPPVTNGNYTIKELEKILNRKNRTIRQWIKFVINELFFWKPTKDFELVERKTHRKHYTPALLTELEKLQEHLDNGKDMDAYRDKIRTQYAQEIQTAKKQALETGASENSPPTLINTEEFPPESLQAELIIGTEVTIAPPTTQNYSALSRSLQNKTLTTLENLQNAQVGTGIAFVNSLVQQYGVLTDIAINQIVTDTSKKLDSAMKQLTGINNPQQLQQIAALLTQMQQNQQQTASPNPEKN